MGVFRADAELYHKMAFGFMKAGLERGELATYITREDLSLVRDQMELEWGDSYQTWDAKKQIQVTSSDSVFPHGFKIKTALSSLAETYQMAIAGGFIGWRIVDITFYPQEEKHLRRLVACDKKYNKLGIGTTTLCMYESPEAYEFESFANLLLCHSRVVSHKLKMLDTPGEFLPMAVDSAFRELFGESGHRGVMAHAAKVLGLSTDEFLRKLQQRPELLRRGLSESFGESTYAICRLVKERLAEMTVDTII